MSSAASVISLSNLEMPEIISGLCPVFFEDLGSCVIYLDFCFQCWCKHDFQTIGTIVDISNGIQCIRTYVYTIVIWPHTLEMEILFYMFPNQVNEGMLNSSMKGRGGIWPNISFKRGQPWWLFIALNLSLFQNTEPSFTNQEIIRHFLPVALHPI